MQLLGLLIIGCRHSGHTEHVDFIVFGPSFHRAKPRVRRWDDKPPPIFYSVSCLKLLNVTNLSEYGLSCEAWVHAVGAPSSTHAREDQQILSRGFHCRDLLHFVFITINTILMEEYRNPFVLISTAASVVSVISILLPMACCDSSSPMVVVEAVGTRRHMLHEVELREARDPPVERRGTQLA